MGAHSTEHAGPSGARKVNQRNPEFTPPAVSATVIQVFARAPVPGQTKTRLIPAFGAEGAAKIHLHLLRQTATVVSRAECGTSELWCMPDDSHPEFRRLERAFGIPLHQQVGADLGARLGHAVQAGLERSTGVILIGTDCPDLSTYDLEQAAQHLHRGVDAVLGPATDGGYYLLALRRFAPNLFADIAWGTDRVLGQTRKRLRDLRWHWRELRELADVDRPEDVRGCPELGQIGASARRATSPP